MINRIVLVGRLVADPELKNTQSGIPVCRFRLAVERNYKGQDGNRVTDFITVVAWKKLAELCQQYLQKGRMAGVEGSLQMNQWEQDGQKRTTYEVQADNVQFLGGGNGGGEAAGEQEIGDEIPF